MDGQLAEIRRWSDGKLLREVSDGNEAAFAVFCERSVPSLYRYIQGQCNRRGIPIDLADDFCQDAIMRALSRIRECRKDGDRTMPAVSQAWLYKVAFNVLRDWQKKNARIKSLECDFEVESRPELSLEEIEDREEVFKFFQWLGNRERDILEYVYVSGMTILEAGEQLGLNRSNSYRVFHDALEQIRDFIKEHGRTRSFSHFDI